MPPSGQDKLTAIMNSEQLQMLALGLAKAGPIKSWVRTKKQLPRALPLTEEQFATDRSRRKRATALNCAPTYDLTGPQRRVLIQSWRSPWSNEMGHKKQLSQVSGKVTGKDRG